jgi:hypothetical protein
VPDSYRNYSGSHSEEKQEIIKQKTFLFCNSEETLSNHIVFANNSYLGQHGVTELFGNNSCLGGK